MELQIETLLHWVIHPEASYAAITLTLSNKGLLENLEKKERKIIRKIIGSKFQNNEIKLISNKNLYTNLKNSQTP